MIVECYGGPCDGETVNLSHLPPYYNVAAGTRLLMPSVSGGSYRFAQNANNGNRALVWSPDDD